MISAVHKSGRPNAFVSMIESAWDKVFTDASNGSDGIARACITSEGECLDRIEVTRSFDRSSWKCPFDASVNSPENRRGSAWMDMWEPKSGEDTQQMSASFGERAALTGTVRNVSCHCRLMSGEGEGVLTIDSPGLNVGVDWNAFPVLVGSQVRSTKE